MAELVISDLSSLNFHNVWQAPEQEASVFVHRIAPTDPIRVQFGVSVNAQTPIITLVNLLTGVTVGVLPVQIGASDEYRYYNIDLTIADAGCYRLEFRENGNLLEYAEFQITNDLAGTKLFRYNNYRNEAGAVFTSASPFYIRLKARLFPQNISFGAESNTFRDQAHALRLLSGSPTTTYKLLFGGDEGAPIWYGDKINRIFSLSEVSIDGEEYVRADSAEVEVQSIADTYPMFNFALDLEKVGAGAKRSALANFDPNYEAAADIEVRVTVVEPVIAAATFEISPTWIGAEYNDVATKSIAVTAPDNTWTVAAEDSSWLTVTKVSQTQATIVLVQNNGTDERMQNVTFTWVGSDNAARTQTLTVSQAYQNEAIAAVACRVQVFSNSNTAVGLGGVTVRLYNSTTGQTIATSSTPVDGSSAGILWFTTQSQYDATTLAIEATKEGYSSGVSNLTTKPDFTAASTGDVLFPNIYLTEIETAQDIEVRVTVSEEVEFSVSPNTHVFPNGGGSVILYVVAPDTAWTVEWQHGSGPNTSWVYTVDKSAGTITVTCGQRTNPYPITDNGIRVWYGDQSAFVLLQQS